MEIYSKSTDQLLAFILRRDSVPQGRYNFSGVSEPLQVASIKEGIRSFPAHKHLPCQKVNDITQEAWVVVYGVVEFKIFDFDRSLLKSVICRSGTCMVTYRGYHSYKILKGGTIVYEIKTGPYQGRELDKVLMGSELNA